MPNIKIGTSGYAFYEWAVKNAQMLGKFYL